MEEKVKTKLKETFPYYPYNSPYVYEEDEIDLYELWLILKKRKRVVFSSILLFLALGLLYIFIAKPKYRASVAYGSTEFKIPYAVVEKAVSDINTALQDKQYEIVSEKLNLPLKDVQQIAKLELWTNRKFNNEAVFLNFFVYKPQLIPNLTEKFKEFLNNLPAIKDFLKRKKEELNTQIKTDTQLLQCLKKLKSELMEKLDSEKDLQVKNLMLTQISNIESKILNILRDLNLAQLRLKLLKGVEIYKNPVIPKEPYSPKKDLVLLISIISGLFLGVFLAFFLEWLENTRKKHEESYKKIEN